MKGNVVLLLLVVVVTAVYGMPSGAPLQACEDLMPQHGSDPQMSTSPYQIDLSPFNVSRYMDYSNNYTGYWYKPGETYTLTLSDPDNGTEFRGFFVQSRRRSDDSRVGTFTVINDMLARIGPCDPTGSSITHTTRDDKTMMRMDWTAPCGTGPVVFVYTVVRTYPVYWVAVETDVIYQLPCDAVNCSGVECGPGEMCVQPDGYDEPVCLCDYAYTYNPNTRACELGERSLPVRLNPTVLPYSGMCSALNTTAERNEIYEAVYYTLKNYVYYRYHSGYN